MTITRVGSNEKYASGWDLAFGGKKKTAKKTTKKAAGKKNTKKAASAKKISKKVAQKKAKKGK